MDSGLLFQLLLLNSKTNTLTPETFKACKIRQREEQIESEFNKIRNVSP
jgi:hypothetical protein